MSIKKNKSISIITTLLIIISIFYFINNSNSIVEKSNFPLLYEEKINNMINQMTIEEKVGQTCQITLDAILQKDSNGKLLDPHTIDQDKLREAIHTFKVGSILNVSDRTFTLDDWHMKLEKIDNCTDEVPNTIPIIYGIDAIHGANYVQNSTLFPQEIALAASWDTSIAKSMGEVTAYETRASGVFWNFSPVLDLGRQPIWSRFFETLGEDVYLTKTLGRKIVEGYQGNFPIGKDHVAACLKHYVGYSFPKTGRDRTPSLIPQRSMEELYLPPFKESIDAGAMTIMVNSGDVNGIPGHANKYLLNDILKEKWGFAGFAVSDWEDFIKLHKEHRTDSTIKDAISTGINAGVDMSMVPNNPEYKTYIYSLIELVKEGRVSTDRLDDAVRRILRVKAELGLLDGRKFDKNYYKDFASEKHQKLAYKSAAESITLLKNDNDILPLMKEQSILLIGPAANDLNILNGAWTHTWQGIDKSYNNNHPTILEQMKSSFDKVAYFEGSRLYMKNGDEADTIAPDFKRAIEAADNYDVAIVCLGELPSTERPGDIYTLDMPDEQKNIVKELSKKGIPIILTLVEGRPKIIRDIEPLCDAVIQTYLPGDHGAKALTDIILGDVNPSGKLPYTYPKYNGVIMTYDYKQSELINGNTWANDFYEAQWDFGFGLSYTTFEYSNLEIDKKSMSSNDKLTISIDVENTGDISGKEVVQLYLQDHYASITPALKKLVRYCKIQLEPSQKQKVTFTLDKKDLEFYGIENKWISEEGAFSVKINNLSEDFYFKN